VPVTKKKKLGIYKPEASEDLQKIPVQNKKRLKRFPTAVSFLRKKIIERKVFFDCIFGLTPWQYSCIIV
jgi:hypothetical protein